MNIRTHLRRTVVLLLASAGVAQETRADEAKLKAYGRHLAGECTACHRLDGVDNGIPSIVGMPVTDFVDTFGFYRSGARENAAMQSIARSLDDHQIKALAEYFASLPRSPRTVVTPAKSK